MAKHDYSSVMKKLKFEGPEGDESFRKKVDARKRELVELEVKLVGVAKPGALALKYASARRAKDAANERVSEANVEVQALEELVTQAFEQEGLTELKVQTPWGEVASVAVDPDITTAVIDRDKLVEWLKANGYERSLTVYANTAAAIAKEILRSGEGQEVNADGDLVVMGGAVRVRARTKTTLRKG